MAGLDIYKDSIYLCVMSHDEAIVFQKTYGTINPEQRQMCVDMVSLGVTEATGVSINTALGRMRYAVLNMRRIAEKNNIVLTA